MHSFKGLKHGGDETCLINNSEIMIDNSSLAQQLGWQSKMRQQNPQPASVGLCHEQSVMKFVQRQRPTCGLQPCLEPVLCSVWLEGRRQLTASWFRWLVTPSVERMSPDPLSQYMYAQHSSRVVVYWMAASSMAARYIVQYYILPQPNFLEA